MIQYLLPLLASAGTGAGNALKGDTGKKLLRVVVVAGVAFGVYKGVKYLIRLKANGDVGDDSPAGRAAEYATLLYNAAITTTEFMNDSLFGDGTNELQMWRTAERISKDREVSFDRVKRAYEHLHGRSLPDELKRELDTNERALFDNLLFGRTTLVEEKAKGLRLLRSYDHNQLVV